MSTGRGVPARELLVVTGKGGVGKTTVAAALALAAVRAGRRVIVAEVAARDDVARVLGGEAAPFAERELPGGVHHISIDPEQAFEEYLRDQLPGPMASLLIASRSMALLAAATPGLRELLSIGKVWELAQVARRTPGREPYDLVILDAPATGHGVAILQAPGDVRSGRARRADRAPGRDHRRAGARRRADGGDRGHAGAGDAGVRDARAARRVARARSGSTSTE